MYIVFCFTATHTTDIYTLSLHDALPISRLCPRSKWRFSSNGSRTARNTSRIGRSSLRSGHRSPRDSRATSAPRSEEHTSELQSQSNLVCRLLLEKKKKKIILKIKLDSNT